MPNDVFNVGDLMGMKIVPKKNANRTPFATGETVIVKMYNGRVLTATVLYEIDTIGGIKVHVESGPLVLTVNADQVERKDDE